MREYIPFLSWSLCEQSILLRSICITSKINGFGDKNFKNERWKNTKNSDQILGHEPLNPPPPFPPI